MGRAIGFNQVTIPLMQAVDQGGKPLADPLAGFKISDQDATSDPAYFGYVSHDGAWYIMKQNTAANSFRYAAGSSSYSSAWTNRVSIGYNYFDLTF